MTTKQIVILIVLVAIIGLAYYAISPLFRNVDINDALPENIIVGDPPSEGADIKGLFESIDEVLSKPRDPIFDIVPNGVEKLSEEEKLQMDQQIEEANEADAAMMDDLMPEAINAPESKEEDTAPSTPGGPSEIISTFGHPASGQVRVLQTTSGPVIRYENFETINGPRLHLYLAKDLSANEFVDLGPIKGTRGNINYEIPSDVDLSQYQYVMYWCVPFGVLFNYAQLSN